MLNEKFFLQSKTIIAAILMLVVQLGPMVGISFGQEDAAIVNDQIDTIMTSVLALIAMWGRVSANSKVVVFKSTGDGGQVNSPWYVPIIAVVFLAACDPIGLGGKTPAQNYYELKSTYAIAVDEAARYAEQPFCSETLIVACAEPMLVVKLDDASDAAAEAFAAGDLVFAAVNSTEIEQRDALTIATVALRQLTAILAVAVAEGAVE